MKSKEVLQFLNISRVTLSKYVKNGTIKVIKLDNGYYDYDNDSIFKLAKKDNRVNYIYARVSTYKQKPDLDNQVLFIQNYCIKNKININGVYSEIHSGIDLDRTQFNLLLDDVTNHKVDKVYITNKDRLTRLSFKTMEFLFKKFGTEIFVINDNPNNTEQDELLEELLNFVHLFSTKMYSNRKVV